MSININSEAACRKAYLNYHCYGNTMGITPAEMGEITQAWQSRISSWQTTVSNDENEYEFDDSEYSNYKAQGEEKGKEATDGFEQDGGEKAKSAGLAAGAGVMGCVMALFTLGASALKAAKGGFSASPLAWVAVGLQAAVSAMYWALRPNKEATEACEELNETMINESQNNLQAAQEDMATMAEQLTAASDEATELNEEANDNIAENQAQHEMYLATYEALIKKLESGQSLTPEEQKMLENLVALMEELGLDITQLQEETDEEVTAIYDDMTTYQEGYDYAAETMGEVQGLTEYAASIDESAKRNAMALGSMMSLNAAASGALAAYLFANPNIFLKAINMVFGGVAAAAAISNGFAATEQFKFASHIGNEIDTRAVTEDLNTETGDIYTEEVDAYDGFMTGVEELELLMPEDTGAPEATVPAGTDAPETENDNQKKKDEEV